MALADRTGGGRPPQAAPRAPWYNDRDVRAIIYQVLVVAAVLAVGWYLVANTLANLAARNIATGFGFMGREAGFAISESMVAFSPADHYARAFLVGLLNTLKVSAIGIVLATVLGTIIGIARLSSNWLIAKLASVYIEGLRNIPLLLQLLFWYGLIIALPGPRQALNPVAGVFLSNRGLKFPVPEAHPVHGWMFLAFLAGIVLSVVLYRYARKRQESTGEPTPILMPTLACLILPPLAVWLGGGAPTAMSVPELRGFNFAGGTDISPEFTALLVGLVTYTAAFIAEIVRAGIQAVPHGQTEAARAIGLTPGRVLRLVVLPQALRVIVPPTTSQYLNLTKNSSLAVGIGYPDLVSVANTSINQTGQAIEGIAIIMAVYLTISLAISAFMNWYNQRIALVER
jgi:general L-amino acid transport system permease protein